MENNKNKKPEPNTLPEEPPYEGDDHLSSTMMDVDLKPEENNIPKKEKQDTEKDEPPLDELLKKKSLLDRLGLRELFKK